MGAAAGNGIMASNARAPGAPPSRIYQPRYTNYGSPAYQAVRGSAEGLGATPQAMMYRPFTPQMPTYTRPSAPQFQQPPQGALSGGFVARGPQPAYRVPIKTYQPPPRGGLFGVGAKIASMLPREQTNPDDLARAIQNNELTYDQYQMMMAKPDLYLPYVQSVQAGNAPTTIEYQQRPVQYMTEAQRAAYSKNQAVGLGKLLGPPPADPSVSDSGGGG